MKKKKNSGANFLVQGTILAAAGIIVRLIGLLYKIPMTRILGDEGIGYYNTAYEIYNIGLILSSYSLPLAVSKLIAQKRIERKYESAGRVFRCGIAVGVFTGGVMTAVLLFGANLIATKIFNSPGSALPLRVMAPTILVFAIMGVFRGFFQGQGNMIPTSVSQVIEQVIHAAVSIWASYDFMKRFADKPNPASYGAAGGTLGTFVGAAFAFLFLAFIMACYLKMRGRRRRRGAELERVDAYRDIMVMLLMTLTPIILSQFVYQLSGAVDNSMFGLIMGKKGLLEKERLTLLGIYGGKYRLLSNVPVAIASSLGVSIIPSIVTSKVQKRHREVQYKVRMAIKFNMLLAIPCAVGMGVLASPVMRLIFGDGREMTAQLMMLGAPAVIFFSLSTVTNAVLQGIDRMVKSVIHSAVSLVIHVGLVYVMLEKLEWGVYGLVVGNVTFALVVCILNWIAIGSAIHYRQEIKTTFILPSLVSAVMGAAAFYTYKGLFNLCKSNIVSLGVASILAIVIYGLGIVLARVVTEEELLDMPMGRTLLRICRRVRLM